MAWATAIFLKVFKMTRMAGAKLGFTDFDLTNIPYSAGAAAGGGAKMGQAFSAARKNTGFKPDDILSTSVGLRGQLKAGAIDAESAVRTNRIENEARIEAAKKIQKAQDAANQKAGGMGLLSGGLGGVLGLATSFIPGL